MWLSYLIKYKSVIGVVAGVLGGIAAIYAITDHYETKGYNRARLEIQSEANTKIAQATEEAIAQAEKEMQEALDRQANLHAQELVRAREERVVETKIKEVIEYVDKIKIKNECRNVGTDIVSLLNDSISTANRASN